MTTLWQAAEMGGFTPLDGAVFEVTTSGTFDPALNRCAIAIAAPFSGLESERWSDAPTCSVSAQYMLSGTGRFWDTPLWSLFSSSGQEVARLHTTTLDTGFATIEALTLQAGVLTPVGTFILGARGVRTQWVVDLVGNTAAGSIAVYTAGAERLRVTGLNHAGFAGTSYVRWSGSPTPGGVAYVSEAMAATENLVGRRLASRPPTGNSAANTGWGSADFGAVDEIAYSDADAASTATANDIRTWTYNTSGFDGYDIVTVGVERRLKAGATGPQNNQAVLRIGGVNYVSSTKALGPGYAGKVSIWEQDPATAANWTDLPTEFGVKAIA